MLEAGKTTTKDHLLWDKNNILGMPELQSPQDIEYLRNQLSINLTE